MRLRAFLLACLVILSLAGGHALYAQVGAGRPALDSDHDGVSDLDEQALLEQFAPRWMTGRQDCSGMPAEFRPDILTPSVLEEDGTIYGQVFPARSSTTRAPVAEIHFYHLWRRDCGEHGHALDAEHVAVLVKASSGDLKTASWSALYWYAAAHENTVCDVSQITRARTLGAEDHGATIWVSPGKHASYLSAGLCRRGCGADRCEQMVPLKTGKLINLGEPGAPMNGSLFIASRNWPLAAKMAETNFPQASVARLNSLPANEIAWFNPGRHPAQGVIAVSASTEGALANSGASTGEALDTATDSTGNALGKSYHRTRHALGTSLRVTGKALGMRPGNTEKPDREKQGPT